MKLVEFLSKIKYFFRESVNKAFFACSNSLDGVDLRGKKIIIDIFAFSPYMLVKQIIQFGLRLFDPEKIVRIFTTMAIYIVKNDLQNQNIGFAIKICVQPVLKLKWSMVIWWCAWKTETMFVIVEDCRSIHQCVRIDSNAIHLMEFFMCFAGHKCLYSKEKYWRKENK